MKQPQFILIVDDSKFSRQLIKEALELKGYQVIALNDGNQAMKFWLEQHPDLTIVNGNFAATEGPFAPSEIMRIAEGKTCNILYLGDSKGVPTVPLPDTPVRFHYLIKPFIIRDLIKVTDGILRTHPAGFVPIFQGRLEEYTVWDLLKKIEEQGLTGELRVTVPIGQDVCVYFKAGQIEKLSTQSTDDEEAISTILNLRQGSFVVYQKLLTFNNLEATPSGDQYTKYKHFVIPETVESKLDLLCELLENISIKLFDAVGRNETVKTLLQCIKDLHSKFPFLQLLNVDFSGKVSLYNWNKELDLETVRGFAELTYLLLSRLNESYLSEETSLQLDQLLERMDARLEEINFYQIYLELEAEEKEEKKTQLF